MPRKRLTDSALFWFAVYGAVLLSPFLCVWAAEAFREWSAGQYAKRVVPLQEVKFMYFDYAREHGKPPASLEDLLPNEAEYPRGVAAIRAGRCVVLWDTPVSEDKEELAGQVLFYEDRVPDKGGWVFMADGHGSHMTAEEFHRATRRPPPPADR